MSTLAHMDEAKASRIRHALWFGLIGVVVVWFGAMPALDGNLSLYFALMLWVTMATSFNIIAGFTGYMPFGYVAFYGTGTYATAVLVVNYGVSAYLAVPLAGAAGVLLALMFAPTLRLGGIYFAIVSLALAVIMQRIMGLAPDDITGGSHGLNLGRQTVREEGYYAMLLILVAALGTVTWLARSRLGKALRAIRDDAEAADAMGVNVAWSRLKAWLLSAFFASLCGGVQAWFTGALDPITAFDVLVTAKTVIYAMAGGLGTVTGPVVGTVILVWVDELIWREFPMLNTFLLGNYQVDLTQLSTPTYTPPCHQADGPALPGCSANTTAILRPPWGSSPLRAAANNRGLPRLSCLVARPGAISPAPACSPTRENPMFTPRKAVPGALGALAIALVAGTATAANPSWRTSKNGWSTEPSCVRTGMSEHQRHCSVLTRGKSTRNPNYVAAILEYNCNTGGEELLSVVLRASEAVNTNDPALSVQWDKQPRETVETWVRKIGDRGKRIYYYNLAVDMEFMKKLGEHRTLTADLPFRHKRERVRFALANAYPSIESALNGCGHLVSRLGGIHQ